MFCGGLKTKKACVPALLWGGHEPGRWGTGREPWGPQEAERLSSVVSAPGCGSDMCVAFTAMLGAELGDAVRMVY